MSWFSEIPTQKLFLRTFRRDPHLIYLQGSRGGRRSYLCLPAVAELHSEFYIIGPDLRWMISVVAMGRHITATPIKLRQKRKARECYGC